MVHNKMEMEYRMAEINDLIDLAGQKDFAKADNVFNELMQDRMNTALDQEKIKIAAQIYNGIEPEELEQDEVDPEDQLTVDEPEVGVDGHGDVRAMTQQDVQELEAEAEAEEEIAVEEPEEPEEAA